MVSAEKGQPHGSLDGREGHRSLQVGGSGALCAGVGMSLGPCLAPFLSLLGLFVPVLPIILGLKTGETITARSEARAAD